MHEVFAAQAAGQQSKPARRKRPHSAKTRR